MSTVFRGVPLLWAVVACSNPVGPDQPWPGDLPEGAVLVTADELEALRASGTLHNIHPDERADARARQQARREADEALVAAALADRPSLARHLDPSLPAGAVQRPDGTVELTRTNGDVVVLMGRDQAVGDLAATLRSVDDADTQRTLLRTLQPAAPPECRDTIAAPEAWEGMGATDLSNAVQTLSTCVADIVDHQPDHPAAAPDAPRAAWIYDAPLPAGDQLTTDVSNDCFDGSGARMTSGVLASGAPTVAPYLPLVRDQGRRGTCVAFATVSALELFVARIYGRPTNLSEQSIYALPKTLWYDEWFSDGLPTAHFLDDLSESGMAVPFEPTWTYNPSPQRRSPSFLQVCDGYDGVMCAENAPQTRRICAEQQGQTYCFVWMPSFADGYSMPVSASVFIHFGSDLDALKLLLVGGFSAVASISVTEEFAALDHGFWTAGLHDDSDESGGHAVHLLAYRPPNGTGEQDPFEGDVLIRNSWGCSWGDNGYAWVPLHWMREHVRSITMLAAEREGGNFAPDVEILTPAQGAALPYGGFFPEPVQLEARADDVEDGEDCCTFRWWSSRDGHLGTGPSIEHTFTAPGAHHLRAYATDSEGRESYASVSIELTNASPTVEIVGPDRVYRGFTAVYVAEADDPNQWGASCLDTQWISSSTSDPLNGTSGCAIFTQFDTVGQRFVEVEVTDADGATGTDILLVDVIEPPFDVDPQVTITVPTTDITVSDNRLWWMFAAVDNPAGAVLSYRWYWTSNWDPDTEHEVGGQQDLLWSPWSTVGETATVTLVFEATDGTDVFTDSVEIFVLHPPT